MRPTVLIHGFSHSATDPRHRADRPGGCYDVWSKQLKGRVLDPFIWESGRIGVAGYFKALMDGFNWRGSYVYAYDVLAVRAAEELSSKYATATIKPDVICHSLGSRVALKCMEYHPNIFNKVIFLNGANIAREAERIIRRNQFTEILNVCVREDDVLSKMGGLFAPDLGYDGTMGHVGIGVKRDNVRQVFLDNPSEKYAKYDLQGDNPDSYGDHHYSYTYLPNWELYRDFLK